MKQTYGKKILTRLALVAALLVLPAAQTFACELSFRLSGTNGTDMRVLPGSTITLNKGAEYTLTIEFAEDHRNCPVPAEDTLFMLDGEKWKANKITRALVLASPVTWTENTRTLNTAEISFTATKAGTSVLNISRVCRKGGYDEDVTFRVL